MSHNMFEFGDTFWLQQDGTAMGGRPAPMCATLHFCIKEIKMIPNHTNIVYYTRCIDDSHGIWDKITPETEQNWHNLKKDFDSHGKLRWKFSKRSNTAIFLDVKIKLINGKFMTSVHEKEMNKYLCVPPRSAHTPGAIRGLICGQLCRFQRLTYVGLLGNLRLGYLIVCRGRHL